MKIANAMIAGLIHEFPENIQLSPICSGGRGIAGVKISN